MRHGGERVEEMRREEKKKLRNSEETQKREEKKKGRRRGWLPPTPKLKARVNDESFLGLCFRESFRERKTKRVDTKSNLLKQ